MTPTTTPTSRPSLVLGATLGLVFLATPALACGGPSSAAEVFALFATVVLMYVGVHAAAWGLTHFASRLSPRVGGPLAALVFGLPVVALFSTVALEGFTHGAPPAFVLLAAELLFAVRLVSRVVSEAKLRSEPPVV